MPWAFLLAIALVGGLELFLHTRSPRRMIAYPQLGAADWLTLRFRLTVVGSLSCFLAAAGS